MSRFVRMEYRYDENIWVGKYRNLHNLPHWHEDHELIYINSGTAEIYIDQVCYYAEAGDCFFCRGGNVHRINGSADSIISTLLFSTTCANSVITKYTLCSPKLSQVYPIEEYYNKIFSELTQEQEFFQIKVDVYITNLMVEIFRKEEIRFYESHGQDYEKYKKLQKILDERMEFITFDEAADLMGFSKVYFSRYFKNMFGMTFSRYMQIIRVEQAILLLAENKMTMAEISAKCGFNSIRTFNRVFRELTGVTPKSIAKDTRPNTYYQKDLSGIYDPTMPVSECLESALRDIKDS